MSKKMLRVRQVRFDIRYTKDGHMEYDVLEPDTRKHGRMRLMKWQRVGSGVDFHPPTWDELHNIQYAEVVSGGAVKSPSGPVEALLARMKTDAHLLRINKPSRTR